MGFDIECIIDIHNYPGEYFCPVCRTLVYPNEALQSQCTHLYCKPCLAHVANNTRACPYDGYLVTEVDSKPLLESDKALAENIGKVRVRCLYHRSGCTWEGPLSECTSHCSGCAFGNSPVVCNRCGIQIVHREVHDHAQSCPGVYQVQQAAGAGQDAASSGSTASTAAVNQNQATVQAGAPISQAPNSQSAPAPSLPGQDSSQQANASSHAPAPAPAPASVPTPEQWYQQHYQQYYQQYAGYDLYQQAYQQHYPYQQAAVQQYQQHPHVLGQSQNQVHAQAPMQAQVQPQLQSQVQPQPQTLPRPQSQSQPQPQQLFHSQAQPVQIQAQVQPQGQPQLHSHVQSLTPQNQNQPQANPQQQLHPAMQSHAQIPAQSNPPHGFPALQSQHYNQLQPLSMQPQPQQHTQVPQYQQPHLLVQHPQPSQVQPHILTQAHLQPQPHSQIQPQPHLQHHAPHPQMRPFQANQPGALNALPQSLHASAPAVTGHQSYPQQPPQQVQLGVLQQNPVHAHLTSGPNPPSQTQGQIPQQPTLLGPPIPSQQQASFTSQSQVSSMPPGQQPQFHPQASQQSHFIQQRPVIHPGQQSVPQQYVQHPHPGLVQPQLHQHSHLAQQQPMQSQLRPQGPPHIAQQNSQANLQPQQNVAVAPGLQPQQPQHYVGRPVMSTHGASVQSLPFAQSSGGFGSAAPVRPAQLGLHQPSMAQNYGNKSGNHLQTASDQQLVQTGMTSTSGLLQRQDDQVSDKVPVANEVGLPSLGATDKVGNAHMVNSVGMKTLKSEAGMGYEQEVTGESTAQARQSENLAKDAESLFRGGKDGSGGPVSDLRVKEDSTRYSLDVRNGKSVESVNQKDSTGGAHNEELDSHKSQKSIFHKAGDENLQSTSAPLKGSHAVSPPASKSDGFEKNNSTEGNQQTAVSGRDQLQQYRREPQLHQYGPSANQQKPASSSILQSLAFPGPPLPGPPPRSQISGLPPTIVGSQGPALLPQPRNPLNLNEQLQPPLQKQLPDVPFGAIPVPGPMPSFRGGPGHFGAPRGPPLPAGDQRDGIMGRGPQHAPEGLFGVQHTGNPGDAEMFQSQRLSRIDGDQSKYSGSFERGSFGRPSGSEPTALQMNGVPGFDSSSLGSQDESFKTLPRENLNTFSKERAWHLDPGSRAAPHGLSSDSGLHFGSVSGGPPSRVLHPYHSSGSLHFNDARERDLPVGVHDNSKGRVEPDFTNRDFIVPGREYLGHPPHGFAGSSSGPRGREDVNGREARSFGKGSRSYNLPSNPLGNSFNEISFPSLIGYPRRGELDTPESLRFGEHLAPGPPHDQLRRGDLFGQDIPPTHLRRGEFLGHVNSPGHLRLSDPASFGSFPGHPRRELSGPGNLPPNLHFSESFVGNKPGLPRLGEPGFRSSFSLQGFPSDGPYAGDVDPFDNSRKRKPVSMGWCRICKVDCETVDGLDMHSQTREHQKMAMDMVMSIKKQNRKKQKVSNDRAVREEASRTRSAGLEGRGNKP